MLSAISSGVLSCIVADGAEVGAAVGNGIVGTGVGQLGKQEGTSFRFLSAPLWASAFAEAVAELPEIDHLGGVGVG
jgi:hypothetical protein